MPSMPPMNAPNTPNTTVIACDVCGPRKSMYMAMPPTTPIAIQTANPMMNAMLQLPEVVGAPAARGGTLATGACRVNVLPHTVRPVRHSVWYCLVRRLQAPRDPSRQQDRNQGETKCDMERCGRRDFLEQQPCPERSDNPAEPTHDLAAAQDRALRF